jgi:CHAD domain-containing protein
MMLSAKRQRKFIQKAEQEADSSLKTFNCGEQKEKLHRLRISIKKIQALGQFINPAKSRRRLHPVKKIFKAAGIIRDISIANQIEEKYIELSPGIKNKRKQALDDAYRSFILQAQQSMDSIAKSNKGLIRMIHPASVHSIKNYFQKEFSGIAVDLKAGNPDEIHSCRKRLKNLFYFYNLLPSSIQKKLNTRIEYIDSLQDKIGQWHDLINAAPVLEKRIINAGVTAAITHETEQLSKTIKKMGENFYSKVRIAPGS